MFIFLSETKTTVSLAQTKFRHMNPNFVVGIDALGTKGGLIVLGFTNSQVSIMHVCQNFILCMSLNQMALNGMFVFCMAPLWFKIGMKYGTFFFNTFSP